jgi:sec-independent protein translocase protein TatC
MPNIHHHLFEIKSRFFYLVFSTFCTFFILYHYKIEIIYLIGKPFVELDKTFIFLDLTEAFYTLLKISTIFTFLLIIPLFMYQLWSFFTPSFYQVERNNLNFIFILFFCLWTSEFLFTYFILLPKICSFLISFEIGVPANFNKDMIHNSLNLQPLIRVEFTARIESYVTLIVKGSSLIFFLFQVPLCVCLLYYNKILHVSIFYNNRKFLSLISLLISAFLVPPDVITQFVVALLFYLVFELLIFFGLFFE